MLLLTPVCIFPCAYAGMYICDVDGRVLFELMLLTFSSGIPQIGESKTASSVH